VTDLGWWFTHFSFLRNAIMHGSDISDAEYVHENQRHLWRGESTLRRAIKRSVANVTTETIMMTPMERIFHDLDGETQ